MRKKANQSRTVRRNPDKVSKCASVSFFILKSLLAITVLLYLVKKTLCKDFLVFPTDESKYPLLCSLIFIELAIALLNIARFHFALKAVNTSAGLLDIASATTCGTWVSLWCPGSAAVAEAVRIAFLGKTVKDINDNGFATVTAAAFVDRLSGFAMMFVFGSACTVSYAIRGDGSLPFPATSIAVLFAFIAVLILSIFNFFSQNFERHIDKHMKQRLKKGRAIRKVISTLTSVFRRQVLTKDLLIPEILGLTLYALMSISFKIALSASGAEIPLDIAGITFPAIVIVSFFPVSIGGFGGQQLTAMAIMPFFGCDAEIAVTAAYLIAIANIVVLTPLAALCLIFRFFSKKQKRFKIQD